MIKYLITNNKKYFIGYVVIAVVSLLFLIYRSDMGSLWYDEMHTFGYALGTAIPNSSFLTFAVMREFAQHIPYGLKYIYLLSEVFFAITIVIMGLIGKLLRNSRTGLYACAVTAFSSYLYQQVALEFRQYFMLFFMTTLIFFLVVLRERFDVGNKWIFIIVYGLCNMMIMDSHEYGKVVAGAVILFDIFLFIMKKVPIKHALSVIFPIAYGVIWLKKNDVGGLVNNYSWPKNPTPHLVYETFMQLLNQSHVLIFLLVIGIAYAAWCIVKKGDAEKRDAKYGYLFAIFMVFIVFAASIIYSNFVNPNNSLYVNRYFISVIVFILILVAVGCDFLVETFTKGREISVGRVMTVSVAFLLMLLGWTGYMSIPEEHDQAYVQSAAYLRNDNVIYEEDSLVYVPDNGYVARAWRYFFEEDGKFEGVNVTGKYTFEETVAENSYERIYVIAPAFKPIEEHQDFLDTYYIMVEDLPLYDTKIYEKK